MGPATLVPCRRNRFTCTALRLGRAQMKCPGRASAYVAVTLGIIGLGSWSSLIVFFVVGDPFGTINDVGNGALALLNSAWR